jgi:hypothetical protein
MSKKDKRWMIKQYDREESKKMMNWAKIEPSKAWLGFDPTEPKLFFVL